MASFEASWFGEDTESVRPLPRLRLALGLLTGAWRHSLTPMMDWSQCTAVERTPGMVSGAWVFRGTRVPVRALFENLEGGARSEDFLEWFPGVTREQVLAVLRYAEETLAESVA